MTDISPTTALVREKNLTRAHYDTVWTITILRGLAIAAVAASSAGWFAEWFDDERLRWVAYALAAQMLIVGFWNSGVADLQREMRFSADFIFLSVRKVSSVASCLVLALTIWPDYRALAGSIVIAAIASLIASFVLSPRRPRLSLEKWRELIHFSKWLMASNALQFLNSRLDVFIVGRVIGVGSVGFYALAMELATLVSTEIVEPVRRAVFPGFAKLQDDEAETRLRFALGTAALLTIAAPIAVGTTVLAEPIIGMLFATRPEWMATAAPMKILALYGLAYAAAGFCWSVIVAKGEPRAMTPVLLASIAVGAPAAWAGGVWFGLAGAATGATLGMIVYAALMLRVAMRITGCGFGALFSPAPRILGAAGVAAMAADWAVAQAGSAITAFFLGGAACVLSYIAALLLFWRLFGAPDGPEAQAVALIRARLPAYKRSNPA